MRNWRIWALAFVVLTPMACGDVAAKLAKLRTAAAPEANDAAYEAPSQSDIPIYFSLVWDAVPANKANPHSIANACAAYINAAKDSIDVCAFEIDNRVIVDALVNAARRGVKIRVVTDSDYAQDHGPSTFAKVGIPVIFDQRDSLMHNKFIIFDQMAVWTGSFNLTENCAYKNNNNAVFLEDPQVVADYSEKFRWFWEYRKFGGKPSPKLHIPYPKTTMRNGTPIEVYFSTHDHVDKHVSDVVSEAKHSIKFLAFSYTHEGIAKAMIERAKAGVSIAGVFEARQMSEHSEYSKLAAAPNSRVLPDGNPFQMHHKVIIIDDEIVVTGSFNFSSNASRSNDENLVVIRNASVARAFNEEFARVYQKADATLAANPGAEKR